MSNLNELLEAIKKEDLETIKTICVSEPSLLHSFKVLSFACFSGKDEAFKELVKLGAKVDVIDEKGNNLAHVAASEGQYKILEYILSLEPMLVSQPNSSKVTPLLNSVGNGYLQATELLLAQGANPNILYESKGRKYTILDFALDSRQQDLIKIASILIKYGAKTKTSSKSHWPKELLDLISISHQYLDNIYKGALSKVPLVSSGEQYKYTDIIVNRFLAKVTSSINTENFRGLDFYINNLIEARKTNLIEEHIFNDIKNSFAEIQNKNPEKIYNACIEAWQTHGYNYESVQSLQENIKELTDGGWITEEIYQKLSNNIEKGQLLALKDFDNQIRQQVFKLDDKSCQYIDELLEKGDLEYISRNIYKDNDISPNIASLKASFDKTLNQGMIETTHLDDKGKEEGEIFNRLWQEIINNTNNEGDNHSLDLMKNIDFSKISLAEKKLILYYILIPEAQKIGGLTSNILCETPYLDKAYEQQLQIPQEQQSHQATEIFNTNARNNLSKIDQIILPSRVRNSLSKARARYEERIRDLNNRMGRGRFASKVRRERESIRVKTRDSQI
ncbi:MAG: Ribulose-5-phosphate 4-epimerase and related epimerase and aldolase [Rickettsiaceae bacterium]|jgi:hypothetical protein|nr:Ribulose-5-phosphate 4-epimerase and related epimerase and aldolase [Rickettsiaceae bacterium]